MLNITTADIAANMRCYSGRSHLPEPKSNGFQASFKVSDGTHRYQVSASAWLIGSKTSGADPDALTSEIADELADVRITARTFSSGKSGFYGQAKVEVRGQRYQCAVQAVQIK